MQPQRTLSDLVADFQSNMPWLAGRTILLAVHGSRAYNTHTPDSDYDYKGVAIPPREYFFGFNKVFEQAQTATPDDLAIYDIRKFLSLAADANPNICEVLFSDPADIVHITPLGQKLLDHRDLFISKKVRWTFAGYAHGQLKKMQRHYRWLKDPPTAPPVRADFGLPEASVIPKDQWLAVQAAVQKKIDGWSLDLTGMDDDARIQVNNTMTHTLEDWIRGLNLTLDDAKFTAAVGCLGYDTNFLELLDRERKFNTKLKEWNGYQEWKLKRNPKRAEIEAKWGYDTKNTYHLVRLFRMCNEVLSTGKMIVKRPDWEELLEIRNGSWSYEKVIEFAEREDKAMDALYKTSTLRHAPDINKIDQLCMDMVEESLK